MNIILYEVEYQWIRRAGKSWRGKRFGRRTLRNSFLVLARSRTLAVRSYLRRTNWYYRRTLLKCEKFSSGFNRCEQVFILNSNFSIVPGWTYEAVCKKVKSACPTLVNNAVRFGLLTKPRVCSNCGEPGFIEGHHADYNEPLQVEWLCRPCHRGLRHGKAVKSV